MCTQSVDAAFRIETNKLIVGHNSPAQVLHEIEAQAAREIVAAAAAKRLDSASVYLCIQTWHDSGKEPIDGVVFDLWMDLHAPLETHDEKVVARQLREGVICWNGSAVFTHAGEEFRAAFFAQHDLLKAYIGALEALKDKPAQAVLFSRRVMLGLHQ